MTAARPCPPAPGPLEPYAAHFDAVFGSLGQRRSFRTYLTGLLAPSERNKTLTALAGAEPVVEAQAAAVQRLQFFLSEASWDAEALTARRLALLAAEPAIAPHAQGVLVLDDTGDRKDGHATAHVARQYLGSVGKTDNGIVAVTSLWADARCYHPLHAEPYTPAERLPDGKKDAQFRTKPQIALTLIERAQAAGIAFRAVVADCFYGDNGELEHALRSRGIAHVMARRGSVGLGWARVDQAHSFQEAIGELPRRAWQRITRRFADGHTERWWAAELEFLGFGPKRAVRAIVATTDPRRCPPASTWYLSTNLSVSQAPLAEVVRLYGLRVWIEEHYKRVKGELGWADFMVRSDRAIRRHWALVACAFSFCWWHEAQQAGAAAHSSHAEVAPATGPTGHVVKRKPQRARGKNEPAAPAAGELAAGAAARARVAGAVEVAEHLLAGVGQQAPAARAGGAAGRRGRGVRAAPLSP